MIANIASDDGLILPHSANPTGSNFRERQGARGFSSAHIPAAVDVDGLAGDVAVAGQHNGDRGDLVHRAEATDRNEGRLDRGVILDHVGFDQRRRDHIRRDPFLGQHGGIGVGEPDQSCFAGRVVRANHAAGLRRDGRHDDDPSPLRVRSPGSAAWVTWKAELRLTRIVSSQSSAVIWSNDLTGLMPALLTRMPIGPSWLSVSRTSAAAASGFATSPVSATACWPPSLISPTTASAPALSLL